VEDCYGQHGWQEFHRNRKDILAEFDKLLEQTVNRPIQVAHGQGVEAYIRKWLAEFLPKKYAVTSGYIIPNLYDDSGKIYHYDIIIYNCLESPVLWTEGNQDNSEQGKYRAIPAKYVIAVYEVKSRLTKINVNDALSKLNQTKDFSDQLDKNYSCGIIFIDLKANDKNKESILKELHRGVSVFGFSSGLVLRFEEDDTCTGIISFDRTEPNSQENNHCKPLAKALDDLNIYLTEDGQLVLGEGYSGARLTYTTENTWSVSKSYGVFYQEGDRSISLNWSRSNFSEFCINLLSALDGIPYDDERRPSFGKIFDKVDRKSATPQYLEPKNGLPFIKVSMFKDGTNNEILSIYEDETIIVDFWIEAENQSETEAIISDDFFKTTYALSRGQKIIKLVKLAAKLTDKNSIFDLKKFLKSENLQIPYRLIYYSSYEKKEFFSIENIIIISNLGIELLYSCTEPNTISLVSWTLPTE
jgi:hypothetical protein